MSELILCVDVGTTNVKAGVVNARGRVLKTSSRPQTVDRDATGKAEHDPEAVYRTLIELVRDVGRRYEGRIGMLVLSTYQMSVLPVDSRGKPLGGIITVVDTRSRQTLAKLHQTIDPETVYEKTGCPPYLHFPLAKIFWMKEKQPKVFRETAAFLGCKDYLVYKLTGKAIADASMSTSTQLMDVRKLTWDSDILNAASVDESQLPPTCPAETNLGPLPDKVLEDTGLKGKVDLILGAYDGATVGMGLGGCLADVATMNIGTTANIRSAWSSAVLDSAKTMRLHTCYMAADRWFPGGAVNNAGSVLGWMKARALRQSYAKLLVDARSVPGSAGLFFLPYLTSERIPGMSDTTSGVFFGLKEFHEQGHMVWAALEGVAFSLRVIKEAMIQNHLSITLIRAGGGGAANALWMQTMADTMRAPIETVAASDPGLVGSAMLGFVACGRFKDLGEATKAMVAATNRYEPEKGRVDRYDEMFVFHLYLRDYLKGAFARHEGLSL